MICLFQSFAVSPSFRVAPHWLRADRRVALSYRMAPSRPSQGSGFSWLFPFQDGHPPLGWHDTGAYLLLPVLLTVSQYATQKLMQPPNQDPSQASDAGALGAATSAVRHVQRPQLAYRSHPAPSCVVIARFFRCVVCSHFLQATVVQSLLPARCFLHSF